MEFDDYSFDWAYFVVKQVEGQLEADSFNICALQSAGDVHVHVQETFHDATVLGLLNLQLREQIDQPLETALFPVDPEEIHLLTNETNDLTVPECCVT